MREVSTFNSNQHGVPEFEDRKLMWQNLKVEAAKHDCPNLTLYLKELRKLYLNGGAEFQSFYIGESAVLDWYISRNQFSECFFFWKFWLNSKVQKHLPIKNIVEDSYRDFAFSSAFHLAGDLASILSWGGAYKDSNIRGADLMRLSQSVSDSLIGDRYEDFSVFINGQCWCEYFHDIAWDRTVVVLDKRKRLIHIMMSTDTD